MGFSWNSVLTQFFLWAISLSLLAWIVARLLRRLTRVRLPLPRIAVLLLVLAFLLALIPNVKFAGPGEGGGSARGGGGGGGPQSEGGQQPAPGSFANLTVRVSRRGADGYEVWLEPQSGLSKGPVDLNNTPKSRRAVVRLLRRARGTLNPGRPMPVRLVVPPALSDVARTIIEDLLSSGGFAIASSDF